MGTNYSSGGFLIGAYRGDLLRNDLANKKIIKDDVEEFKEEDVINDNASLLRDSYEGFAESRKE